MLFAGNFNHFCDDVLLYNEDGGSDYVWMGRWDRTFDQTGPWPYTASRTVAIGDFDGDHYDDLLLYGSGSLSDTLWWGSVYGAAIEDPLSLTGSGYQLQAGDWNGNGVGDLYLYSSSGTEIDKIKDGSEGRQFTTVTLDVPGTGGSAHGTEFLGP